MNEIARPIGTMPQLEGQEGRALIASGDDRREQFPPLVQMDFPLRLSWPGAGLGPIGSRDAQTNVKLAGQARHALLD